MKAEHLEILVEEPSMEALLENKARGSQSQERDVFHAPRKAQGFIRVRRGPARLPEQAVESSASESK